MQFEIKNNTIYISIFKNEILGYKSNKYVQDLHEENYKSRVNEPEELSREIFHVHGEKDSILPSYKFFPTCSIFSIQSQSKSQKIMDINKDINCGYKLILKFLWRDKGSRTANTILKNKV